MIRKLFLITSATIISLISYSQEPLLQVTGTAGTYHQNESFLSEWTIGEIMVSTFSNNGLVLTQGFHQFQHATNNLLLQDLVIGTGPDTCFSATQTITMAGDDSYFIAEQGASLTLVAGNNIVFKPGVHIRQGAYMLAYITTDDTYCPPRTDPDLLLQDILIAEGPDTCFSANQTISLAGDETYFIVENGASITLVAGHNILFRYGTYIRHGAYMLAHISSDENYCQNLLGLLTIKDKPGNDVITDKDETQDGLVPLIETHTGPFSRIYPNPTTGVFNLELTNAEMAETTIIVEIFGYRGESIIHRELSGQLIYTYDLSGQSRGIYFVRVISGSKMDIIKVVKQ